MGANFSHRGDFRLSVASKVTKANQELLRKSANNTLTRRDLQNHLRFLEREHAWLEQQYEEADEEQKRQYLLTLESDETIRSKALVDMRTCSDIKQRASDCLFFIRDAQKNAVSSKAYRKCVALSKQETKKNGIAQQIAEQDERFELEPAGNGSIFSAIKHFYCFVILPFVGCWIGMQMFEEQSAFWRLSSAAFFWHICCMAASSSSPYPRIRAKGEVVGQYQLFVDLMINTMWHWIYTGALFFSAVAGILALVTIFI